MNFKAAVFFTLILLSATRETAASGGATIIAHPFAGINGIDTSLANDFTGLIREVLASTREIDITLTKSTHVPIQDLESPDIEIQRLISATKTGKTTHILAGKIAPLPDGMSITTLIISVKSRKLEYRTFFHAESRADFPEAARVIGGRISLFLKSALPPAIEALAAVPDHENGKITLSWNATAGKSYAVYRSPFQEGAFRLIGESTSPGTYSDATVLRGMEYRYGIGEILGGVPTDPTLSTVAHLRAPLPAGLNLSELQKKKTVTDARLKKEKKDKTVKRHIAFLDKYYLHPVKLSLAMMMSKSYLDNGTLIALEGFTGYSIDPETRLIVLSRDTHDFCVELKNNSFFTLMMDAEKVKLPDIENLKKRLLLNSTAYCVLRGEKRITDEKGYAVHVPCYEALGISTEYFKNYANWKSSTLMMGTSDGELKKKIKEARDKGSK